jgi:hypothetical protein
MGIGPRRRPPGQSCVRYPCRRRTSLARRIVPAAAILAFLRPRAGCPRLASAQNWFARSIVASLAAPSGNMTASKSSLWTRTPPELMTSWLVRDREAAGSNRFGPSTASRSHTKGIRSEATTRCAADAVTCAGAPRGSRDAFVTRVDDEVRGLLTTTYSHCPRACPRSQRLADGDALTTPQLKIIVTPTEID